jgi:transcriptional regulator with XRE-family HTH domain
MANKLKRLKELRESRGVTQDALAKMLQTTQQTIARWETGKAEPDISGLRDLAMIFGTSIDDLVDSNPISQHVTTSHMMFGDGQEDGYWGNVGLLIPGQPHTRWYPITRREADQIGNALNDSDSQWVCFSTLNNRMVVMNPTHLKRVWLLDEACDAPSDWELGWDSLEGNPLEFYRSLDEYNSEQEAFRASASPVMIKIIEDAIEEHKWDEDAISRIIHETSIWLSDGEQISYWVEDDNLWTIITDIENDDDNRMFRLDSFGGEFESFYPRNKVAVIEMPLVDVMAAAKSDLDESEAENAAIEAEASEPAPSKPALVKAPKPIKAPTIAPDVH